MDDSGHFHELDPLVLEIKADEKGQPIFPRLLKRTGEPMPEHWPVFTLGETVTLKERLFVVRKIGDKDITLRLAKSVIKDG